MAQFAPALSSLAFSFYLGACQVNASVSLASFSLSIVTRLPGGRAMYVRPQNPLPLVPPILKAAWAIWSGIVYL